MLYGIKVEVNYLNVGLCFESTRFILQVKWVKPLKLRKVEAKVN